ncbi:hypothetical protein LAZ67_7000219 [Cordylochernes scorpioides]|uniref:Uncharacterized protein n=1 Tax=Cordylochernes scorpioides TaxID=51811 RepID=A0ABY6KME5_9ARAC|nr:hypothetical protein LAZ67_7000219 [Cordylochernes scorpioides]
MVETLSGKIQDPAQERVKVEEPAKPQPGATISPFRAYLWTFSIGKEGLIYSWWIVTLPALRFLLWNSNSPPFYLEVMTSVGKDWIFKQIFSSPYHHQANGLAEYHIQTLEKYV